MNILITGAGGAAAISFYKAVQGQGLNLFMADMDAFAAGLYLVPESNRIILPRGNAEHFIPTLVQHCQYHQIDVLVPTVETEMLPIDEYRNLFEYAGTKVMMASRMALKKCLDKWTLMQVASSVVPIPHTTLLDEYTDFDNWAFPFIAKTRKGSGSNGVYLVKDQEMLKTLPKDGSFILQHYLPGMEYSVDVLATPQGKVVATVPRERLKIDSGIAVAARIVSDERIEKLARNLVEKLGITFVANVQFKLDADGMPRLLEVNPRFPGTMPLTVASGINMPLLCLKMLQGYQITSPLVFKEIAVVRYLQEEIVEINAIKTQELTRTHLHLSPSRLNKAA